MVRLSKMRHQVSALSNARIVSATEELHQIADDIRDAQATETAPIRVASNDTKIDGNPASNKQASNAGRET